MTTQTYRPGDIVPRDGLVECTQYPPLATESEKVRSSLPAINGVITTHEVAPGSTSIDAIRS
jgi:hypothetical protein